MRRILPLLFVLTAIGGAVPSARAQSEATRGLEKLKSLAGIWHGTGPDGSTLAVSYEIASGGTALMETRVPSNEPEMITLFHLDGDALALTHYCSAGNQPRMQAEPTPHSADEMNFAFVDVSNLTTPSAGHMRALRMVFQDDDHLTQVWTWREGGQDVEATFHLERDK